MKNNNEIPSFEECEEKFGKLINMEDFRAHLKMSRELANDLLEKGEFGKNVLWVGKDVQNRPGSYNAKCYFKADWAYQLKREDIGYMLKDIAEMLDISYRWLRDISTKGYLEEARIASQLWDLEWFKENLSTLRAETYSKKGKWKKSEFYDLLSDEQKNWIERYLDRRKKGQGIRVGRSLEWTKPPAKVERSIERWRKELSIIFYKIICGRLGIPNYFQLEQKGKYRPLTIEERKLFLEKRDCFKVIDFSPSDIDHIAIGYKETTFSRAIVEKHLTPFLYFVLNTLKEEWVEKKQKSLINSADSVITEQELALAKDYYETFDMTIELSLSKVPTINPNTQEEIRTSVYLTHEQVLLAKNIIRNHLSFQEPIKRTLLFMFGCLVGIRPDEFAHLKIENFALDKTTKLLKRFIYDETKEDLIEVFPNNPNYHKGWGQLFITHNKGGYSPSHPKLGTLIVPRLATFINAYLEQILYQQFPEGKGKGYFIRPKAHLPEQMYDSRGMVQWLTPFSEQYFTFLDEVDRKNFKYYDVRHTIYNLLMITPIDGNITFQVRERAAQIHVRHDIKKRAGNTGRRSYTDDISLKDYFNVIDKVLNFPWDLNKSAEGNFYEWAESRNIIKSKVENNVSDILISETKECILVEKQAELIAKLKQELEKTENLADKLANGPRGEYKDVAIWTNKTLELDKKIKKLKQEIQKVMAGERSE